MTTPNHIDTISRPLWRDILEFCRMRIMSRRGLLTLAAAWALAGIFLNWNWLVAVGIAPVLIAVLPCLVMCGLGLCMNKLTGNSCESSSSSDTPDPALGPVAVQRLDANSTGPAEGSVPLVRHQPARRKRKQAAKRQTRAKATSRKET